jgi:hypothetical protein
VSVLIIKDKKMKKTNLLTLAVISSVLVFTSCSKDKDTAPDCAECHIALADKSETVWEILDADGDHIEFCGQDLVDAEANSREVTDTLYAEETGDTLLPGFYGKGSANPDYQIHCGEEHIDE